MMDADSIGHVWCRRIVATTALVVVVTSSLAEDSIGLDTLANYVGVYEFEWGRAVSVQLSQSGLMAQLDDDQPVQLLPKGHATFVERGTRTRFHFEEQDDQTTSVDVSHGSHDSIGRRLDAAGIAAHEAALAAERARVKSQTPDPRSESTLRELLTCWHSSDQFLLRRWPLPGWLLNSVAL
jgi:hypothetical protein